MTGSLRVPVMTSNNPGGVRLAQLGTNSVHSFRHVRLGRSQIRIRRPVDLNQTLHKIRRAGQERSLMLHDGIQHPGKVAEIFATGEGRTALVS
jgi:hypothetical protein